MPEIYTTNDGLSVSFDELKEMLDAYDLNQLNYFYYGLFNETTKKALKPYFVQRMKDHGGI